ncbi:centrosomal protein of 164 kDa-like [Limulus polyphemus]|uniref:Centrosomal protein of 164 kDa-like n=1 Tax=Limulus polyphemus TaxID=6850 RepID=A0ABM1T9S1_LIMPO|nr:centrosomal protein of 164 kDa-like [Limulus polyphemus]
MNTCTSDGQQKLLKEVKDEIEECVTDEDIALYGKQLGIDVDQEQHLLWIAEEGLQATVPPPWCPVEDPRGRIYYYNQKTDEASWEHPLDPYYRSIVEQERQKSKSRENTLDISDQGFDSKLSSFADGPLLKSTGKDSVSVASETKSLNVSCQGKVGRSDKKIIQPDTLIKNPSDQRSLDSSQLVTSLKQTQEEMTGTEKGVIPEGSSRRSLLGKLSGMLKENPRIVKQDNMKSQVKFDLDSDSEDKSHYSYEVHMAGINEILMLTAHDVQQTSKENKKQENQDTNLKEVSEKNKKRYSIPI